MRSTRSSTWSLSSSEPMPRTATAHPGKTTLAQLLSISRKPAPSRVADASEHEARPNAVLEVLVLAGGKVIQRWQSKARWEGPLPRRYTETRAGAGWKWDNAEGRSIKVQTDERGAGGRSVE